MLIFMLNDRAGVQPKPPGCDGCAFRNVGRGFCPDYAPENPKLVMWLEAPGQEEILWNEPLMGKAGQMWLNNLVRPLGYEKHDVLIVNTLRCNPPGNHYPTAKTRVNAESHCRQYDLCAGKDLSKPGIASWGADCFIITLHPAILLRTKAPFRLIQNHVAKAFEFAASGRRPVLAMGDKAMGVVAPHLDGGVKKWAGHWEDWSYDVRFKNPF